MANSGSVTKSIFPAQEKTLTERDLDWAVVQKVQAGNVGAFDRLVQKYREHIFSVIYNMTSNREDASDLTQETFIKAFQAIARFKGKSSFLLGSIVSLSTTQWLFLRSGTVAASLVTKKSTKKCRTRRYLNVWLPIIARKGCISQRITGKIERCTPKVVS